MSLTETIAAGLIIAALTGLTYIAYKHPKGFLKFYAAAYWVLFVGWCFSSIFDMSMGYTVSELTDVLEYDQKQLIRDKHEQIELPMLKIFMIGFGMYLYLIFLKHLPEILEVSEE